MSVITPMMFKTLAASSKALSVLGAASVGDVGDINGHTLVAL